MIVIHYRPPKGLQKCANAERLIPWDEFTEEAQPLQKIIQGNMVISSFAKRSSISTIRELFRLESKRKDNNGDASRKSVKGGKEVVRSEVF